MAARIATRKREPAITPVTTSNTKSQVGFEADLCLALPSTVRCLLLLCAGLLLAGGVPPIMQKLQQSIQFF